MNSNLPPMPVRAFRDEFLREDGRMREGVYEEVPPLEDYDPHERCDFEKEDD